MRQRLHPKCFWHLIFLFFAYLTGTTTAFASNEGDSIVTVINEKDNPLPGVTVYTSDFRYSAITDLGGQINVKGVAKDAMLTFSYLGYTPISISLENITKVGHKIQLLPKARALAPVTIVGRRDDRANELPYAVDYITEKQIQFTNAQTSADALDRLGTVFLQKSQMGGGSPIIRGFEANRVLLVVDGVRMNNAIYRNGHLQNAITVDADLLDQMEVIYGPGSLMYGSDALGGVIHFRTKDPMVFWGKNLDGRSMRSETNFYTRYSSANNEKTAHLDFNIGGRKWGFLTSLSYSDFDDLRAGKNRPNAYPNFGKRNFYVSHRDGEDYIEQNPDPNRQIGTGYAQFDLMQKVRYQPNNKFYIIGNFQLSTTSDIPRYDQLTEINDSPQDLKFAEWYYGPQFRSLLSVKARMLNSNILFDKATIIGAYQNIGEDRHDRRTSNPWLASSLVDVDVYSFTADFDKGIGKGKKHKISYGLDVAHNIVSSEAFRTNLADGSTRYDENARYPSQGSQLSSVGAYTNYQWRSRDTSFLFNAGLRYSFTRLDAQFGKSDPVQWPTSYIEGVTTDNGALTWSTGLNYSTKNQWHFRALVATAFRSPNIDDFVKIREKSGTITVPNTELRPEHALTTELTIGKVFGEMKYSGPSRVGTTLSLSATGFYTQLTDAIIREAFLMPNGDDYFLSHGDTLRVLSNINSDRASIYGLSGNLILNFSDKWQLKSSINWTKGVRRYQSGDEIKSARIDTLVPQDHIPPMYGQTSLSYRIDKFRVEALVRYNGRKRVEHYAVSDIEYGEMGLEVNREGTADNIEQGIQSNINGELVYRGLYGWTTYNLYMNYELTKNFSINFGVENITDLHYRPFASGVSAPGRNFIVSLRGQF